MYKYALKNYNVYTLYLLLRFNEGKKDIGNDISSTIPPPPTHSYATGVRMYRLGTILSKTD